ncbi:hypothetical protein GCM10010971_26430 [Silvimonas amylolytica]|uniref:Zinc-binding dehydrogenase n=2 Tax=Silvimonas amylolytica TaxID=449663 RepID=A0ABQ2PMI9_9NEIS|nr:hypothetical protein GCM10010971_26430 [Silvimonas amylolytica]
MAVETAYRSLDQLQVVAGTKLLVHGAGTTVGFAAVQIALLRGAQVFATAGATYADQLRAFGAQVTNYGEGMAERIKTLAGSSVDLALDTAPVNVSSSVFSSLPDLIQAVGNDPRRVLTIVDFAGAARLGTRTSFDADEGISIDDTGKPVVDAAAAERLARELRHTVLGEFARLAADGRFMIPVARTFPLKEWRAALEISLSGKARGKLILIPDRMS